MLIFVGSYFPLSLILLAQDYRYEWLAASVCVPFSDGCVMPFRNAGFSITLFALCLGCFLLSIAAIATVQPKTSIDIIESKYVPAELMSYTLPYVVSFMSLEYQETGKFVGLIIFLGWMFLITYRSGQLILNPLLIVFGWRLYEVKYSFPADNAERIGRVLSKVPIEPNHRYRQSTIEEIMVVKANHDQVGEHDADLGRS
ncbi:hypothetical protein [Allomesorhizobium camelthorni]|uniref:Uncharacterized protein n=1 Tax=Allomesorhizobium camelthorni TaxID=475069 RepID=A0A6G4WIA9_9HYPH|nr:hypothetical protein [Mesorhizobium camelthorni]NGO54535.1 hypothetical protein [Mesorhizobium camelthorni]